MIKLKIHESLGARVLITNEFNKTVSGRLVFFFVYYFYIFVFPPSAIGYFLHTRAHERRVEYISSFFFLLFEFRIL